MRLRELPRSVEGREVFSHTNCRMRYSPSLHRKFECTSEVLVVFLSMLRGQARIFLCTTVADMQEERRVLLDEVLPRLQARHIACEFASWISLSLSVSLSVSVSLCLFDPFMCHRRLLY